MKHLKLFENFVLESVLSKTDIYDKYYKDIDSSIFNEIVKADPTSINDKVGKYSKWLINLFKSKSLKLEDLYKATEYLKAFDMFKHKLSIKDINAIKSLPELFKLVEPYLEKEEFTFTNDEERKLSGQFKEVYRNEDWRVIIPLTLNASKYFGRDTEWCTTNTDMFKKYTREQDSNKLDRNCLYIIYPIQESEDSMDERLQFHFGTRQFMDVYDDYVELNYVLKKYNIEDFFKNIIENLIIYTHSVEEILTEYMKSNNISFIKNIEELYDYEKVEDFYKNEYDDYSKIDVIYSHFQIDEHPMDSSGIIEFRAVFKNKNVMDTIIDYINTMFYNSIISGYDVKYPIDFRIN